MQTAVTLVAAMRSRARLLWIDVTLVAATRRLMRPRRHATTHAPRTGPLRVALRVSGMRKNHARLLLLAAALLVAAAPSPR